MNKAYIETASAATLSQSELFVRFLEAKLRVNRYLSSLVEEPVEDQVFPAATMEERFLGYHGTESCCFDHDFAERMLDELRLCEDPEAELEAAVGDLENLLDGVKLLHHEFRALCEQARTEQPDNDKPAEVLHEWITNPRYVLPVIEQKEAA